MLIASLIVRSTRASSTVCADGLPRWPASKRIECCLVNFPLIASLSSLDCIPPQAAEPTTAGGAACSSTSPSAVVARSLHRVRSCTSCAAPATLSTTPISGSSAPARRRVRAPPWSRDHRPPHLRTPATVRKHTPFRGLAGGESVCVRRENFAVAAVSCAHYGVQTCHLDDVGRIGWASPAPGEDSGEWDDSLRTSLPASARHRSDADRELPQQACGVPTGRVPVGASGEGADEQ